MTAIAIDLETIPGQTEAAHKYAQAITKPPATLKKAESIQKWWDEESEAAIDENFAKQSFDALHGEVISIALTDGDRAWVKCRKQGESELELLQEFGQVAHEWCQIKHGDDARDWSHHSTPYFIAHNAAFDLPFLWRRMVVLGYKPPFKFPNPSSREGKDFGCTMVQWAGWGKTVSLKNLAEGLGIPSPKDDIDGSQVYGAWKAGEYDRIAAYNLRDTATTMRIWDRMVAVR